MFRANWRPSVQSDWIRPKRLSIEHSKSYRTVYLHIKLRQHKGTKWIIFVLKWLIWLGSTWISRQLIWTNWVSDGPPIMNGCIWSSSIMFWGAQSDSRICRWQHGPCLLTWRPNRPTKEKATGRSATGVAAILNPAESKVCARSRSSTRLVLLLNRRRGQCLRVTFLSSDSTCDKIELNLIFFFNLKKNYKKWELFQEALGVCDRWISSDPCTHTDELTIFWQKKNWKQILEKKSWPIWSL